MISDQEARQQALEFILNYHTLYSEKKQAYELASEKYRETQDEEWRVKGNVFLGELFNLSTTLSAMQELVKTLAPQKQSEMNHPRPHLAPKIVAEALATVANYGDDYAELKRRRWQIRADMRALNPNEKEKYQQLDAEDDQAILETDLLENRFESAKAILAYEK